jgi:hypothetical protein
MPGQVSIRSTVAFAYGFAIRNAWKILGRVLLPAIGFWASLYFSFAAYLIELERFLRQPNDHAASLVLGLAMTGFLLPLFFHSILMVAVCKLALGKDTPGGWLQMHVSRDEWRLYAALLRLLLIAAIALSALYAVFWGIGLLTGTSSGGALWVPFLAQLVGMAAVVWAAMAVSLLLAPIALEETGQIVRRAWRLACRSILPLGIVAISFVVPCVLIQMIGEYIMRHSGLVPPMSEQPTLLDIVTVFRSILPALLLVLTVSYVVGATLFAAGAVPAYSALVRRPSGA